LKKPRTYLRKPLTVARSASTLLFFSAFQHESSGFARKTAHGAIIRSSHASRQRKISLRQRAVHEDSPADSHWRNVLPAPEWRYAQAAQIGKDLAAAHAALLNMDDAEMPNEAREVTLRTSSDKPVSSQRKTVIGAARSTSNAANRNHARPTLATAQPSISLP
jgi:hypothetical protein